MKNNVGKDQNLRNNKKKKKNTVIIEPEESKDLKIKKEAL